jgi:hypothetical protein
MPPDDQQFGELVGEVRGISGQISELQRTNTEEHAANARRLGRIEDRIDSLESTRDKFGGFKAFLAGISGAVLALAGYIFPH